MQWTLKNWNWLKFDLLFLKIKTKHETEEWKEMMSNEEKTSLEKKKSVTPSKSKLTDIKVAKIYAEIEMVYFYKTSL